MRNVLVVLAILAAGLLIGGVVSLFTKAIMT